MKLPMNCDDFFHAAFQNNVYYKPIEPIYCHKCGTRLKVYYAEERLYAVRCCYCESITLVKASNPAEAASYVGTKPKSIADLGHWNVEGGESEDKCQ